MFGYDFRTVQVGDIAYDIPITYDAAHPERTEIGPVPPEVLAEYEIVYLSIPFLLRRDRHAASRPRAGILSQ